MADQPTKEPTAVDAAKIAQAGTQAIIDQPAESTPAQAQDAAQAAMQERADQLGVRLTDDDCQKIAAATIAALEARGAFDGPPVEEPGPAGTILTTQPEAAERAAAEQQQPTADPVPAIPEEPPARKTLAQRFMGE